MYDNSLTALLESFETKDVCNVVCAYVAPKLILKLNCTYMYYAIGNVHVCMYVRMYVCVCMYVCMCIVLDL